MSDDEGRPRKPVKHVNRWLARALMGCLVVLLVLGRRLVSVAFVALFVLSDCWGQFVAGFDTSAGRKAVALWFPRATGDAVHNVYYYQSPGFTDQQEYMRFDTNDSTIVRDFISGGSGGRTLHPDTTLITWLTDGVPRWFHRPPDARQFRDSAGFDYLWVSPDGHRVWFFFFSH